MIDKYVGKKVLITTSEWFVGPDGKDHRAVWGTLNGVHEAGKALGFIPNRAHANWFYDIGGVVIMGCQVKYLCLCPDQPSPDVLGWTIEKDMKEALQYTAPFKILIAE
ncbi:hypothetical protein [Paraflavitalea pollutisoli]|uniref:hypothetical protein n=1 Tax=Paraflavitalea pollutisoli TaxID=3034143 RepID=UPI0023ECBA3D|nr:hypothetical protein [Paraflavitalea sp. H1-2-19X]